MYAIFDVTATFHLKFSSTLFFCHSLITCFGVGVKQPHDKPYITIECLGIKFRYLARLLLACWHFVFSVDSAKWYLKLPTQLAYGTAK